MQLLKIGKAPDWRDDVTDDVTMTSHELEELEA